MADHHAIDQLLADYAWFTDVRDVPGIAGLFLEDGEMGIEITGGATVGPLKGREAIADFISTAMKDLTDQRRHVVTNVRYESEAEAEATVTAFLTLFVTENGELDVRTTGFYRMEAVEDGDAWRIRRVLLTLDRGY
jgi:uncharacterized protein (TIGR02246 family)